MWWIEDREASLTTDEESSPRRLSVKRKPRRAFGVCESRKKTRLDWQHRTWAFLRFFSLFPPLPSSLPPGFSCCRKGKKWREKLKRGKDGRAGIKEYTGGTRSAGGKEDRGRWAQKARNEDVWFVLETGETKGTMLRWGGNAWWVTKRLVDKKKRKIKSGSGSFARGKIFNPFAPLATLSGRSTEPKSEWHIYILNGFIGIRDPRRRNNRRVGVFHEIREFWSSWKIGNINKFTSPTNNS